MALRVGEAQRAQTTDRSVRTEQTQPPTSTPRTVCPSPPPAVLAASCPTGRARGQPDLRVGDLTGLVRPCKFGMETRSQDVMAETGCHGRRPSCLGNRQETIPGKMCRLADLSVAGSHGQDAAERWVCGASNMHSATRAMYPSSPAAADNCRDVAESWVG